MARVGIYLCDCGPNIAGALDMDALGDSVRHADDVVRIGRHSILCSPEGRAFLVQDIVEHGLDRVVIGGCSPKEHEATFRDVLREAGLNPYRLQIANLREQCAWTVRGRDQATGLARDLLAAAAARVLRHDALTPREYTTVSDVVVVGAGIAGMHAALALARKDRTVHLVERLPCVGGKVALYEDVFPGMECASCVLDPWMDELLHHEGIQVHLLAELEEVLGFSGNFTVRIRERARYVDAEVCLGCGACTEACPVEVPDAFNPGLASRRAVYLPYPGALPHLAIIDPAACLRWRGQDCRVCEEACPFDAIRYGEEDRVLELRAGAIVLATGFDLYDPSRSPQYGYGRVRDVITAFELERMMNASGPTGGELRCQDGQRPSHVGFVLCVGSRNPATNRHCSEVCCRYTLKSIQRILASCEETAVTVFHADLHLPGREAQDLYRDLVARPGVTFVRMDKPDSARIDASKDRIEVRCRDDRGCEHAREVDLAVLAPAMLGAAGSGKLADALHLKRGGGGFFDAGRTLLDPVATERDGILVAGCAGGAVDIPGASAQGLAATGRIQADLVPGEVRRLDPVQAVVNVDRCSGCGLCERLCGYGALEWDGSLRRVTVNEVLCRGCGVCAAACPSGAIRCFHYTDEQISAEVTALLSG